MRKALAYWYSVRYSLSAPFYIPLARLLTLKGRKASIKQLSFRKNDKVLIVGCGSGIDLQFLPKNIDLDITAVDISNVMIKYVNYFAEKKNIPVNALVMDAEKLEFEEKTFDIVILHLILSVVESPVECLREVKRVLKDDGQVVILDNLSAKNNSNNFFTKFLKSIPKLVFSDFSIELSDLLKEIKLKSISSKRISFVGISDFFVIAKLKKITH